MAELAAESRLAWPFKPITGATYLDLPKAELNGPGITGTLTLPRSTDPVNTVGNSTFRKYDVVYGGGAANLGGTGPLGFNALLTRSDVGRRFGLHDRHRQEGR